MMTSACFAKQNEPIVTMTPTDNIEMKFRPENEIWFIRHYIKDSSSCNTASSCNLIRNEVLQYESFKMMPSVFGRKYSLFSAYQDFINNRTTDNFDRKYTRVHISNDFFRFKKFADFSEKRIVFDRYKKEIYSELNNGTETYFSLFGLSSIIVAILCGLIAACGNYSAHQYKKRFSNLRTMSIVLLCIIGVVNIFIIANFPITSSGESFVIIFGFIFLILIYAMNDSRVFNLIASISFLGFISLVHIFQFEDFLIPLWMFIAFIISYIIFSFFEGNQKWVKSSKEKLEDLWDSIIVGILKFLAD